MAALRQLFQTSDADHLPVLRAMSAHMRAQPGCLQAEDFRSIEFDAHLTHLELWESPAAWDAAWSSLRRSDLGSEAVAVWQAVEAPFQLGHPASPRETGQDGLELYRHALFDFADGGWEAIDPADRASSIRWPAWSAVRIVIQAKSDPTADIGPRLKGAAAARAEVGCRQFEHFRSLDHAENTVVIELWADPQIFDLHWMNRLITRRASGVGPFSAATFEASRFEFYNACRYILRAGVFTPETPGLRAATLAY
ncbi:antibiotic biosynthesis monooxygenase [Phenylobacterium immobile]|uniref:antibiotic biosynthesis monooxygenase n=1 Tax=Phenylobacterium immobile TaxID=21 RepID=UPI000B14FF5D|nr:antibiotic biosynthesis monooxygenase [Phenylobacterium immobile]